MIIEARCIQESFESRGAQKYFPGSTYQLDFSKPEMRKLADLKTHTGEFIFQFDRAAANSAIDGLFFCPECRTRFDSLNLIGTHMNKDHKKTFNSNEMEVDPDLEKEENAPVDPLSNSAGDRRGKVPVTCKGCGQTLDNIGFMSKHKLSCPGKAPEVVAQEPSVEVAQGPPPA